MHLHRSTDVAAYLGRVASVRDGKNLRDLGARALEPANHAGMTSRDLELRD